LGGYSEGIVDGSNQLESRPAPGGTGLTKGRIEALSDGVFAIAITLMIFNIKVPALARESAPPGLGRALLALWPQFLIYAISFIILGVYWVGHHNQFHYIRRGDRTLLWLNVLFLMFVTLVPFSTALLGQYPSQQVAVVVYALSMLLTGFALYGHWWYATSGRRLVDADLDPTVIRLAKRRVLLGPALLIAAIAASFLSTKVSILLFAAIPLFYVFPGRIDRHWSARR
jgi:uncharacterized membrane protein